MIDHETREAIHEIGFRQIERVRRREPLEAIEEDSLHRLSNLKNVRAIVAGFNRRSRNGRNISMVICEEAPYLAVVNVLDGNTNYDRRLDIYGTSISVTNLHAFEQYSVVFDALCSETLEIGIGEDRWIEKIANDCQQRVVVGLGRMFRLSKDTFNEMSDMSLRSFGSTTVSIIQVLRGRIDVYINKTKMWNIWWALGLCDSGRVFLEDLGGGGSVCDTYRTYLVTPHKTIYLACYSDPAIKEKIPHLLDDIRNEYRRLEVRTQ